MSDYIVCPGCHRQISADSKFCVYCGATISDADKKVQIENSVFSGSSSPKKDETKRVREVSDRVYRDDTSNKNMLVLFILILILVTLVLAGLFIFEKLQNNKLTAENTQTAEQLKEVQVPDVTGMSIDDATSLLNRSGISYSIYYEESSLYSSGYVIRTYPGAGVSINENTSIDLYVCDFSSQNNNVNPLYQIEISGNLNDSINIRSSISVKDRSNIVGAAFPYEVYDVYETRSGEGYTWYRIGNNRWVADDGAWINRVNNTSTIRPGGSFPVEIIDDTISIYDKPRDVRTQISSAAYGKQLTVYNAFYDGMYYWYEIGKGQWIKEGSFGERITFQISS